MDVESAQKIVQVLAAVLQKLIEANDNRPETGKITKFHALRAPSISVKSYLERIAKYANCSGECFVLALVYIDRLIQRNNFVINSLNVHRILITSVMLAAKFFDDHYYNNTYYAKIGGVPRNEMNLLELEFLFLVNFSLYLDPNEYQKYHTELCSDNTQTATLSGVPVGTPSAAHAASASSSAAIFPSAHNVPNNGFSGASGSSSTAAAATPSSAVVAQPHHTNSTEIASTAMEVQTESPTNTFAAMDIETDSDSD